MSDRLGKFSSSPGGILEYGQVARFSSGTSILRDEFAKILEKIYPRGAREC